MSSDLAKEGVYSSRNILGGVIAGLVAGSIMGLLIQFVMGITPVIGFLYLQKLSLTAGWIAHLFHSVIFALVFVALVSAKPVHEYLDSLIHSTGLGIGYGVLTWLLGAVVVMPIWLQAVGFGKAPSVPNISMQSLVGHLVFGALLGASYKLSLENL